MDLAVALPIVSPALALESPTVFSHFKFALKVSSFRRHGNRRGQFRLDGRADIVATTFDLNRIAKLRDAFAYLTDEPLRLNVTPLASPLRAL